MILYSRIGKPVELGVEVGRGGEATVYQVVGDANRLAKIYNPEPRSDYPRKLAWMLEHPPENPTAGLNHASLAWPDSLLYDPKHKLKGYCMPYIAQAVPLLDVFNPRRRALILPRFDRRYLHRTAHNLAAAFGALHRSGYVAGDVNESNVLVTPAALVTLIDADSFQVVEKHGGADLLYPCPVGKPEYTPPELQGKTLAEVKRVPDQDSFGLAVLIFQLLMGGSHPFRAQWLGQGDPPPLEKRIAEGDFPYTQFHSSPIAPPPNTPDLDSLHPWLGELFRRCFIDGHRSPRWRPGPELWARAITEAEGALVCCSEGHFFDSHLSSCPYCALLRKTPVEPATRRQERSRHPGPRWARAGQPGMSQAIPQVSRGPAASAPASSAGVSSAKPQAGRSPAGSGAQARGFFTIPLSGRPAAAPTSAAGAASTATVGPNLTGLFWSRVANMFGNLRQWPLIQSSAVHAWYRWWISTSLITGGGQGGAAGTVPGILVALICWLAGTPLDWSLILGLGGAAGGLLRGWRPGNRLAALVDQLIGWQRFWQGGGMLCGAIGGSLVGMLAAWAVIPVLLGVVLGAKLGFELGAKIWQLGSNLGWEKIWGSISALGAAGFGWGAAKIVGVIGLNSFGAQLTAGLLPYSGDGLISSALLWLLAGGLSGAFSGAIAGLLVDLVGRMTRLTR